MKHIREYDEYLNEGFSSKGDLNKIRKALSKGKTVTNGMNEAYKLGDKWSNDFDYVGMLEMGAKAKASMGVKKLQSLFNSFEDVNYHSEASPLSYAIDELKDGNKAEANRLMKEFNKNCQDTLKHLSNMKFFKTYEIFINEAKMSKEKIEGMIWSLENEVKSWHPSNDSKKKAMLDKLRKKLSKFESVVTESETP